MEQDPKISTREKRSFGEVEIVKNFDQKNETLDQWLSKLFFSTQLNDKLDPPNPWDDKELKITIDISKEDPGRGERIQFSNERIKFPKAVNLQYEKPKAMALHYFANHELLAIEIMAWALLKFKPRCPQLIREMIDTIVDEQKHFTMYLRRMNKLGVKFGEYPLNDFFWKHFKKIQSIDQYFSLMSLTFETANLDFMIYFSKIFRNFDDQETSNILNTVLKDELRHVKLGHQFLFEKYQNDMWEKYCQLLPWPITPARSKGIEPNAEIRKQVFLSERFFTEYMRYSDEYRITNRKH
jgi:uncharacterized ferritin-like protein (DUF455 family)